MNIKTRIKAIREEIPKNITLLAATKNQTAVSINKAIESGIEVIGENYVQEAQKKYLHLKKKIQIHLIGHLQTNKVKQAVEIFDMIQTIDSEKIALEIDKRCKELDKTMPVLIEINIGKEPSKKGCLPSNLFKLAKNISILKNIKLKGLMTMAPYNKDPEKSRPYFKKTKMLFENLKNEFPCIEILSFGMSDSYKIAIEEGSTMIRLGTLIFGKRK